MALLRFVGSIAVALVALLLCLELLDTPRIDSFAAEHVKRSRYPSMSNVSRDEDYSRFRINSLGLIGAEPLPIDDASIFRIAAFGDSFVEAAQLSPDKNFLALLEDNLTRGTANGAVETWNFGFAGDNTGNAYARWRNRPTGAKFNTVVFTFNDGDLLENSPFQKPQVGNAFLIANSLGEFALDESHIGPPIGTSAAQVKRVFGKLFFTAYRIRTRGQDWVSEREANLSAWLLKLHGSAENAPAQNSADPERLAADTFAQLRFVQAEISRAGVRCVIVGLPTSRISVPGDKAADPVRREAYLHLSKLLRDASVPFVDMMPFVEAEVARGKDLYGDWEPGGHFNRAGHELVAKVLAEQVRDSINSQDQKETR